MKIKLTLLTVLALCISVQGSIVGGSILRL